MPFTPAHAAAALPFRRSRLPTAAIAIGCLAPDLLYFLRLTPHGRFGHTLPGVFLFDLPVSLGLFWIWRAYLLPGTLAVVTSPHAGREALAGRRWSIRSTLEALAAILVGIATHLLWDSFTHHWSWPYRHIALLRADFDVPLVGAMPGFDLLQMLSSIAGLLILAVWLRNHWRDHPDKVQFHLPPRWGRRLLAACVMAAVLGVARGLWGTRGIPWNQSAPLVVVEFLVTSMAILFLEWLAAAMIVTYKLAHSR